MSGPRLTKGGVPTARPVAQKMGGADDFQTPPAALAPLLSYLRREWVIWEPACGTGNIVQTLGAAGFAAVGTDLLGGKDFFTWKPPAEWPDWDAIVTNPPYSLKDQWLARCYELGKPFALLVPFTILEGQKRQALYRKHGVQALIMDKRVHFETPSGAPSSAWFPVCWLCWQMNLPSDLLFAEPRSETPAEQGVLL